MVKLGGGRRGSQICANNVLRLGKIRTKRGWGLKIPSFRLSFSKDALGSRIENINICH